jgi:23S rRNA (cytosine1962-C5)-methyltransferase
LRVTATAESVLRSGHPWLYADSIREQDRSGSLGEVAVVYDRKDRFLAVGLFDPESTLRVRILHVGKPVAIDRSWWQARLREAIARRSDAHLSDTELVYLEPTKPPGPLPRRDAPTTGYRWIHGESDGWPGLVLDRYDTTLVVKLYTAAWLPRLEEIVSLIRAQLAPDRLILRLSRNIQSLAERQFQRRDGQIIDGPSLAGSVLFQETGLRFEADVLRGQKTGFFLDQRDNRRRVEALAAGLRVLNVFSFSGGFSLYAARGGAGAVTDVDISRHALDGAERNFALNRADRNVASCPHERVQADAFEWLESSKTAAYDLIILDPPSLAKRESERTGAVQAYRRLVSGALPRLRQNAILVACSCSAHVSSSEFLQAVRQTLHSAGRTFSELGITFHPPDHPAGFHEAEYLKAIYLQLA